jgi:TusA-related sulfurtransferase
VIEVLDTTGLRTPKPLLKVASKAGEIEPGSILEVMGDCPSLEGDIRFWCKMTERTILSSQSSEDGSKIIHIQF